MNECFTKSNLLTYICQFLDYTSIIAFSQCNITIHKCLDPNGNNVINLMFLQSVQKYFQFDEDEDIMVQKKMNLLDKFGQTHINWKNFLKKLTLIFRDFEDKTISDKVKDFLQIHIYLPDLRKNRPELEFENSSIHQLTSYDRLLRRCLSDNFYSKYITKEYLLNGLKIDNAQDKCIKILKEGIFFEKELLHYSKSFNEFVKNEDYMNFVMNALVKYDYVQLYHEYNNDAINEYYNNNKIINLILWINNIFITCCDYGYEYMNSLNDKLDVKTFILEFVHKHEEIINIGLLINSSFDNINIIINQLLTNYPIYQIHKKEEKDNISQLDTSMSTCYSRTNSATSSSSMSSENNEIPANFSLYKLFLSIMKKNFYEKISEKLTKKFTILANIFSVKLFNDINEEKKNDTKKKDEDEMCDNTIINTKDECEDMDIDEYDENYSQQSMEEKEPDEKEVIENFMKSLVDYEINELNANAINHTELKTSNEYKKMEDILINQFLNSLKACIEKEEKPLSALFEIIEKNTKCRKNDERLIITSDSLDFIRKTKKNLMKKSVLFLLKYFLENLEKQFLEHIKINNKGERVLYLNNFEIKYNNEYVCDLNNLSSKKHFTVTDKVNQEINNLKTYLTEKFVKSHDSQNIKNETIKLIDEYINCDGIESVLLIKKMIWFYYKELGIYEEKNETVEKYLKGKKYCYLSEECSEAFNENNLKLSDEELFQLFR